MLLDQTELVRKPDGMLVAFIDFAKAYDKVNQEKLWSCLQSVGVKGRCLRFIQALYEGSVCSLRQGCVLSPLIFLLYSVVKRLKEEKCGVECGGETIPGLLLADDTCLVAS